MATLTLKNLAKIYNNRKVVQSVSISLESGAVVGLLGPNGAGKSTTFYMTVGIVKPDEGQIFLDNENVTDYPMYLRAKKGIGYLPQEASIFKKLSVKDNILVVMELLNIKKEEQHNVIQKLLTELGIEPPVRTDGQFAFRRRKTPAGNCTLPGG
jgi:lipopolysaccharide export system ATP-binding protein